MISTSSSLSWVNQSYELGALRYIVKPIRYGEISKILEVIFALSQDELKQVPTKEMFLIQHWKFYKQNSQGPHPWLYNPL